MGFGDRKMELVNCVAEALKFHRWSNGWGIRSLFGQGENCAVANNDFELA